MAENSILNVSRHGFGNLFRIGGRDNRMQFWLFGALVFAPLMVVQLAVQIALTLPSLEDMGRAAAGDVRANGQIFEAQMRGMATAAYANIGIWLLGSLLMLAAAGRRLHDRGRSAGWALILPTGLFAAGLNQAERTAEAAKRMPAMMAEMERQAAPDPGAMFEWAVKANVSAGATDWLAVAGGLLLLGLLIDLARAGVAGPNRFGAAPQ